MIWLLETFSKSKKNSANALAAALNKGLRIVRKLETLNELTPALLAG
jgi:hypothetical protein